MTLFSDGTCTGAVTGNRWTLKDGKLVFITTTQDGTVVGAFNYFFQIIQHSVSLMSILVARKSIQNNNK